MNPDTINWGNFEATKGVSPLTRSQVKASPMLQDYDLKEKREVVATLPEILYDRYTEKRLLLFEERLNTIGKDILELKALKGFIKIQRLPNKNLKIPLDAIVDFDEVGYLARTTDLPVYGYGDDPIEAIEMLKREIESLHNDLMADDDFSDEWIEMKKFLAKRITG